MRTSYNLDTPPPSSPSFCVVGIGGLSHSHTLVFRSLHHGSANILISVNAKTCFYKGVQIITAKGSLRFGPSSTIKILSPVSSQELQLFHKGVR